MSCVEGVGYRCFRHLQVFQTSSVRAVGYENSFLTFLVDGVAAGKRLCYSTRVYPTRFNKIDANLNESN